MSNNIIDWSEAFDGVGRILRSTRKKRKDTKCYDENDYEVECK